MELPAIQVPVWEVFRVGFGQSHGDASIRPAVNGEREPLQRAGSSQYVHVSEVAMSESGKIFADAGLPATPRYGAKSVDCHTLREAVLEWMLLSDQDRTQATITSGGTVYNANEIDRLPIK